MRYACRSFLLLLLFPVMVQAAAVLRFDEHIGRERADKAIELVRTLEATPPDALVIEIDSYTGDLQAMLELAGAIYRLKTDRGVKTIVYVKNNAVGPSAVLPFLADELYVSRVVAWGDVPAGSDTSLPLNLLRSRMRSLIPSSKSTLLLLADGMIDPDTVISEANGQWRQGAAAGATVVSPKGETLVVHEGQLEQLGLISGVLSPEAFESRFLTAEEKAPTLEATPVGVDEQLAKHIVYNLDGSNTVGRIEIGREGITQSTWIHVKSAIDQFIEERPTFVILDLNTPGGEVFSSQQISDALKDLDTNHDIPVVAFIDNWAISAGAMLAYSCRFIVTVKDGAMGAAQPIMAGGGVVEAAPEKVSSALRADFANRAGFFERNPLIAQAMVDADLVLVERFGEIVQLQSDDEIRKGGISPDKIITTKGKLLTLTANQMIEFGVADIMTPPVKVVTVTEAEEDAGRWPASKSLLFTYPFFEAIPDAEIVTHQMDWKTSFFSFLANPAVASVLFLVLMLGFYIEMNTPGFGIPGTVALVALFFIVLASFSMQAAGWLEVILLVLGLGLVAIEVFVLPGFGIAGILGIIITIGAIAALLLPGLGQVDFSWDTGELNAAGEIVLERLAWLAGAIIVGAIIMTLLSKYVLPKVQRFSRLVLRGEQERSQGYVAGLDVAQLPDVGAKGIARTPLRPAGKVLIMEKIFDASSVGSFIDAGKPIVVVRYDAAIMIVEESE